MSWEKVPIKDVCEGIYDGPHATPPLSESGAIFLGIQNFKNGRLDFSDVRYISEEDLLIWTKRVIPQAGDIVFSYEATLNLYAIIPAGFRGCLGRRMALIRVDKNKINYRYLYYYLHSPTWKAVIAENTVTGATVDRIPLIRFPDFEIELPPLDVQNNIADILSAYDDLIENNQRQIKLLEEAAMRLYREWFVFMRFPGHESVRIEDGVPEGWEKKKVSSIMKFVKGKNLGDVSFEKLDGYEKLLLLDGLESDVTTYGCAEKQVLAKDGDILMLMDGARSSHTFITDAGIVGSTLSLIEITENQIPVSYVKGYFDANLNLFVNNNTGSAIPHANRKFIEGSDILIPNLQLLENYDNISGVFLKRVRSLNHMNQQLRISRDALLPRLMNGGEGLKLEGGAV